MFGTVTAVLTFFFAAIVAVFDRIANLHIPFRLHLFEWCDLTYTPDIVKHLCQSTLTTQWTRRLPLLQSVPPATHATQVLTQVLANITDSSTTEYTVIDFCSGSGGPIPTIEKHLNARRTAAGIKPITFRLSDLYPDLDSWIESSSHSEYLNFIPQPVNAMEMPASTISVSARQAIELEPLSLKDYGHEEIGINGTVTATELGEKHRTVGRERRRAMLTAGTKVIHLFCLSFHHFDDEQARVILGQTLRNADAFVVLELQDRSLGCLAMMMGEGLLVLALTWWWFWGEWVRWTLTYLLPVLPFVHWWDGLVSCMRTRTFGEMKELINGAIALDRRRSEKESDDDAPSIRPIGSWTVSEATVKHTWPSGRLHATVGIRDEIRR